jgi:DNA (cytosine-5)-methyltransferase 1
MARSSAKAKRHAENGAEPVHPLFEPALDPGLLMPALPRCELRALSLFSGCGGLDLGFDLAGFTHAASYELLEFAADTIRANRPDWKVFSGVQGDVTTVDWDQYARQIDVIHGGPPCQPFSTAGRRQGSRDPRDMIPEFVRAVLAIEPAAFVVENVAGLLTSKFSSYVRETVYKPLQRDYTIVAFELEAAKFGVPQRRRRVFFVGFRDVAAFHRFTRPSPTHRVPSETDSASDDFGFDDELPVTQGVRAALGLPTTDYDSIAPTIRCTLTGPRGTTSIVSSTSAMKEWQKLGIWANGVGANREAARRFAAKDGHYRLSVDQCALLQGFPATWQFRDAVHRMLGQIGNSVAPPMAYNVAVAIRAALLP